MNSINNKSRKNRSSTIGGQSVSHGNSSNVNSNKQQSRQKSGPSNERTVTPEGIYVNGRVMHVTTSLVGCVVQVEVKDGTRYEGVLRTFSPDFELVIDTVAKVEPSVSPPVGSVNIGNLLSSLQAKNQFSPTVIFNYADVVKLAAVNVDLEFAANKGQTPMMTDTDISRFDPRSLQRDRQLVPWDASGDGCDLMDESLENHGSAQNGWDSNDMFKLNEEKFNLNSTYDPTLKEYTVVLTEGEGVEFEQKRATAERIANQIENDSTCRDRYNKELCDGDEEELYSAVHRPSNESVTHSYKHQTNRRRHNQNFNAISNNGPPGIRTTDRNRSHNPNAASPPFHTSNKNTGAPSYNKSQYNSNSSLVTSPTGSSSSSYQSHNKPLYSNQHQPKEESAPSKPPYAGVAAPNYAKQESDETPTNVQQTGMPQRTDTRTDNRRFANKQRKEEVSEFKKFSTDFKLPSDGSKENSSKTDSHQKDPSPGVNTLNNTVKTKDINGVNNSAVKDKESNVQEKTDIEKTPENKQLSPSQTIDNDPEKIAKKSTLNPNAKSFTPRSPLTPVNTSSTPPSVSSTPSSTVSLPMNQPVQHQPHHHHQQHPQQQRLQNPLMQIQPQYIPTALSIPMAPNQYFMTNVAMTPPFNQPNVVNQQPRFRGKGPQQYPNHGLRHDFTQPSPHVAAATGHPVLASGPITAPQLPVNPYPSQQPTGLVTQTGPQMYPNMYATGFHPRMNVNVMPPHMQMMQHTIQYDPTQLQHLYATGQIQLHQHLVSQAQAQAVHQHAVTSVSGPHSTASTPQSATPTTPMHGAPSPVHHQPNQPPTPTPQQTVMYATVPSPHNPQTPGGVPQGGPPHSGNTGTPYHHQQILVIPSPAQVPSHHGQGHGGPLHHLSHNPSQGNHHGGGVHPIMSTVPLQLISSNAAQGAISFAPNPGV